MLSRILIIVVFLLSTEMGRATSVKNKGTSHKGPKITTSRQMNQTNTSVGVMATKPSQTTSTTDDTDSEDPEAAFQDLQEKVSSVQKRKNLVIDRALNTNILNMISLTPPRPDKSTEILKIYLIEDASSRAALSKYLVETV